MTVEDDYLELRELQSRAREEIWHAFSHHEEFEKEWNGRADGNCYLELKQFLEWEPKD